MAEPTAKQAQDINDLKTRLYEFLNYVENFKNEEFTKYTETNVKFIIGAMDAFYGVQQIFGIPRIAKGNQYLAYLDSLFDKDDLRSFYKKSLILSELIESQPEMTQETAEIKTAITNGLKKLDEFNFTTRGGQALFGQMYHQIFGILTGIEALLKVQTTLTDTLATQHLEIDKLKNENGVLVSNLQQCLDENKRLKSFQDQTFPKRKKID
jgi:hypothetical protein